FFKPRNVIDNQSIDRVTLPQCDAACPILPENQSGVVRREGSPFGTGTLRIELQLAIGHQHDLGRTGRECSSYFVEGGKLLGQVLAKQRQARGKCSFLLVLFPLELLDSSLERVALLMARRVGHGIQGAVELLSRGDVLVVQLLHLRRVDGADQPLSLSNQPEYETLALAE